MLVSFLGPEAWRPGQFRGSAVHQALHGRRAFTTTNEENSQGGVVSFKVFQA